MPTFNTIYQALMHQALTADQETKRKIHIILTAWNRGRLTSASFLRLRERKLLDDILTHRIEDINALETVLGTLESKLERG